MFRQKRCKAGHFGYGMIDIDDLLQLSVHGGDGRMVPLSEVTRVVDGSRERSRYHKNLQPVTYVYGEVAGRFEAPVYAILELEKRLSEIVTPLGEELEIIASAEAGG